MKYGETYCYKVRAVFLDGSKNEYCQLKKVEIKPEKTNVNVNVDDNKLKITWDELDYVDGYNIYIGLNYKENIVHVGDVVGNITSYIYDEWLEYYADYYIVVEPYVYNGQGYKCEYKTSGNGGFTLSCGRYYIFRVEMAIW